MADSVLRNIMKPRRETKFWRQDLPGYTFLEVLIYIAILALLTAASVTTLVAMHRALAQIRVTRVLNGASAVALERIIRTIRAAQAVDEIGSVFDATPGVLVLTGAESPPLTHRFFMDGSTLYLTRGSDPPVALTPPGVLVASLIFRATTTPVSRAIKVEVAVESSSGRATTTQNLYGTVILRNSY